MIKTSTVAPLVNLFGICPIYATDIDRRVDVIKYGLAKGYIVDLKCANDYAMAFLNDIDMQYNSTFYKTWTDILSKSRIELLFDQVIHYISTYGTDFTQEAYVPNLYPNEPEWNTYKTITPCSFHDLYDKCMNMLVSGIALKSDTVKYLTDYIIECAQKFDMKVEVDTIKNREAMVIICDALKIFPKDGAKLLAHIIYKTTGKTMIVKNRELRHAIRLNTDKFEDLFNALNENQKIALAGVFNRYKQVFIAFKTPSTRKVINRISHLSKKYHKPMVRGFWETCLNMDYIHVMNQIEYELERATNFKLLQVMQSIRERLLQAANGGESLYVVRNGKIFIKSNEYPIISAKYTAWENIYNACRKQLIKNLSAKKCKVKFPEYYNLTCPTSEKNFIGDFPFGTSCKLGKESVIGIYWRNEWGTHDFDLSYEDMNGNRISWNANYYSNDQKVIYSGDITNAPNGANEAILFNSDEIVPGIVNVNRYNGKEGSKFRMFFGTQSVIDFNAADICSEHMINPNKLQFEAEIKQGDMTQSMIGAIIDNTFYFFDLSCGYGKVMSAIKVKNHRNPDLVSYDDVQVMNTKKFTEILSRKVTALIDLKEILLAAGFKESNKPDLDLTNVDRSTLIELFSK